MRGRRAWIAAGGAAVLVAVVAVGLVAGRGSDGSSEAATTDDVSTAEVTRGDLTRTSSFDGTVAHGDAGVLRSDAGGTLTRIVDPGTTVEAGQPLGWIDERPVMLLTGTLPAYRTLALDPTGATALEGLDVQQLEENLLALGYGGEGELAVADDRFDWDTYAAVRRWQDATGQVVDGSVELGEVVYAPTAVRVEDWTAEVGDRVAPGADLAQLRTEGYVVALSAESGDADALAVGTAVSVDIGGRSVEGTVVSQVVDPEGGLSVTVALDAAEGLGDGADADVVVERERREQVLTVPVVALLALAEGGYGVEVAGAGADGASQIVAVGTGMFGDGRVELVDPPASLAEGTKVVVPS